MLRWLPNASPKVKYFFLKIVLFSVLLHLIIFVLFFFGYQNDPINLVFKTDLKNLKIPINFLPLQKSTGGLNKLSKFRSTAVKQSKNNKILIQKNIAKKNKAKNLEKNKILQKTIMAKNKEKEKKKLKEVIQKKDNEEKKIEAVEKKNIEEKIKDQNIKQEINEINAPINLGRRDIEILELQENINNEITKSWHPPAGLSKNLNCVVKVSIDFEGKITKINIEQSSKSLVFDMSIKRDLQKIILPKEVWGQEILITLNNK